MRSKDFQAGKGILKTKKNKIATAVSIAVACLIFVFSGCETQIPVENGENAAGTQEQSEGQEKPTYASIEKWTPKAGRDVFTDRLIAHGGGNYEGYATTNSVEAVISAVDQGYSLIEMDMNMSSDGKVIMIHDWDSTLQYYYGGSVEESITAEQFDRIKVHGRFETLNLEKLICIMDRAKGFKVITDAKDTNLKVLEYIAEKYPDYKERFIPQIYQYDEYEKVKLAGYEDIILTLYEMEAPVAEEIIEFCKEKNIYAVTLVAEDYARPLAEALISSGIKLYRHPVSSFEEYENLINGGNYGVYTSSLIPKDILGNSGKYYITVPGENEQSVRLTEYVLPGNTVADIVAATVTGLETNEYRIYYIDDERLNDASLATASDGKHDMKIEIWKVDERFVGHYTDVSVNYILWKEGSTLTLLDSKYGYRADQRRLTKQISSSVMNREARNLLEKSFVACSGSYCYYSNGEAKSFKMEDELMYAFSAKGEVYLPISETAKALGAEKIAMDEEENIFVQRSGYIYRVERNEATLNVWPGRILDTGTGKAEYTQESPVVRVKMDGPLSPVLHKTSAPTEYYAVVFARDYIEEGGIAIILPEGVSLNEEERKKVVEEAKNLFQ